MLKKFLVCFVLVFISCFILFFLLKKYDFGGNTINWILSNKIYLLILCLSIAICLTLYGDENPKSKFILYFIIIVNSLYLCFLFVVGNIGLSWMEGLAILAFLIFGFVGIYIKNWLGYIILSVSLIGCLGILFFGSIPLFENGPDFKGFEKNYEEKILIYSNIDIDDENAQVVKDNKIYKIVGGLKSYDLKIKNIPSQIIFKSDRFYGGVYCFLVFKGGDFIEILPQSAITISDKFEVDVLTGIVKYYSNELKNFSFVSGNIVQETSQDVINKVRSRYNDSLRLYLKTELGSNVLYNKSVLKISKKILDTLSRLFPGKYEKNLENLQEYVDVFGIDLNDSLDSNTDIKTKSILKNMWGGMKRGIDMTD